MTVLIEKSAPTIHGDIIHRTNSTVVTVELLEHSERYMTPLYLVTSVYGEDIGRSSNKGEMIRLADKMDKSKLYGGNVGKPRGHGENNGL
jgi:hypothetical protein